mmetsp:Transcript_22226/g.52370  ORF Transcript_22226/g.52370 Transcript_22226/m.52370 type:complete len:130 (+) Transcript_22226:938-1327(+)
MRSWRLPKLPQRKPPKDGATEPPGQPASTSTGSTQAMPQPSSPPTTLGPQTTTVPLQVSNPVQPTIIPVSLDTAAPGIQLRLAEHLTPQPLSHVFQAGDSRAQSNILITQLPQQTSGGNLLSALLQNQR